MTELSVALEDSRVSVSCVEFEEPTRGFVTTTLCCVEVDVEAILCDLPLMSTVNTQHFDFKMLPLTALQLDT